MTTSSTENSLMRSSDTRKQCLVLVAIMRSVASRVCNLVSSLVRAKLPPISNRPAKECTGFQDHLKRFDAHPIATKIGKSGIRLALRQRIIISELSVISIGTLFKKFLVDWIAKFNSSTPFKHPNRFILYGVMPCGVNFLSYKG